MSSVLKPTVAIIVLCLAAMGSVQARAANYQEYRPWSHKNDVALANSQPGYANSVSSHWSYHVQSISDKRGH
jgi:hypothetical protein